MVKTLTAIKARQNLGEILNEAYYRGDEFIVERSGKPVAAIVPIEEFEQWQRSRDLFFKTIAQIQSSNKKIPESKIQNEVYLAIQEVRALKKK